MRSDFSGVRNVLVCEALDPVSWGRSNAQGFEHRRNRSGAGLVGLGVGDRLGVRSLPTGTERRPCRGRPGFFRQLGGELAGDLDGPWRIIDVQRDLDRIASATSGHPPSLCVERKHETSTHRGNGAAVLVAAADVSETGRLTSQRRQGTRGVTRRLACDERASTDLIWPPARVSSTCWSGAPGAEGAVRRTSQAVGRSPYGATFHEPASLSVRAMSSAT